MNNTATSATMQKIDKIIIRAEHQSRAKAYVPWWRKDWIQQIKTISGRAWNKEQKYWSLPLTIEVVDFLKTQFGDAVVFECTIPTHISESNRLDEGKGFHQKAETHSISQTQTSHCLTVSPSYKRATINDITVIIGDSLIVEQCNKNWLRAYVPYDKKSWIQFVKNVPARKWNAEQKCWLLPYTQQTIAILDKHLGEVVVYNFVVDRESVPELDCGRKEKKAAEKSSLSI